VWRGWRPRRGWPGRWAWLVVLAAATALAVAAVVLVSAGRPARHTVSARSAQPLLLAGVPAHGAGVGLFLGGESVWRPGRPPRPVAGLLSNGLSPLLPPGHGAEVDQLAPVPGGVVVHISDISTGVTYGALGRVVFIPTANAPARMIARATMIAVSPGGRRIWMQTAVQSMGNGVGVSASFRSPTWAVDLTGRRVSPVLHLPLGLAGATGSGPLTLNLVTGRVQLWNGARPRPGDLVVVRCLMPAARHRPDHRHRCCLAAAAELATGAKGLPAATGQFRPSGPAPGPPAQPRRLRGQHHRAGPVHRQERDAPRDSRPAAASLLSGRRLWRRAGRHVGPAGSAVGAGDQSRHRVPPARVLDRRRAAAHVRPRPGQPGDTIGTRTALATVPVTTADSPHRGLSGDDRGQAGHLQAVEQVAQRLGVAVECRAAVTG
jgi:hypothetical protein